MADVRPVGRAFVAGVRTPRGDACAAYDPRTRTLRLQPWAAALLAPVRTRVLDAMAREVDAGGPHAVLRAFCALSGYISERLDARMAHYSGATIADLAAVGWPRIVDAAPDGRLVRIRVTAHALSVVYVAEYRSAVWTASLPDVPAALSVVDDSRASAIRPPTFPVCAADAVSLADAVAVFDAVVKNLLDHAANVSRLADAAGGTVIFKDGVPHVRICTAGGTRDVCVVTPAGFLSAHDIPAPLPAPECAICALPWADGLATSLYCPCGTTLHAACWLRFARGHPATRRVFARTAGVCPACEAALVVDE